MRHYKNHAQAILILLSASLSGIGLLFLIFAQASHSQNIKQYFYVFENKIRLDPLEQRLFFFNQNICKIRKRQKVKKILNDDIPLIVEENTPPTEEYIQSLLSVFGNDSLRQRTQHTEALNPKPKHVFGVKKSKRNSPAQKKSSEDLIAESLATLSQLLPFKNDMRLGSDSNQDIYVQLNASQNWTIDHNLKLDTSQTYRYGVDHRNYFNTHLKLSHTQSPIASAYSQFNLTYINHDEENFVWEDRTYQKYQFLKNHALILGLYSSGYYDGAVTLNSWGPYISWKRPIWRTWLFIQSDLSYYNDYREEQNHYPSALIRLEALF